MSINETEIGNISEKAWVARESGNPILALALWQQLLHWYESQSKWQAVIDTLVDVSVAWKILGKQTEDPTFYQTALSTLNYITSITNKHQISLRKDWDYYVGETEVAAGEYQNAISRLEKYLRENDDLTPEERANVNCHIGFAKVKLGDKTGGVKILEEGIKSLENPTTQFIHKGKDVIAIWRTGAKLKLAQVLDDKQQAQQLIQQALDEARQNNLGARIKEAQSMLEKLV